MKIGDLSAVAAAPRLPAGETAVLRRADPPLPGAAGVAAADQVKALAQGPAQGANQAAERSAERPKAKDVHKVAEQLNRAAELFDVQLKFAIHEPTHEIMVKVIDTRTGKVLREIPPEKLLNLAASMQQTLGLVMDAKA